MDVIMPQLGETVTEGTVLTWFKQVGEAVKADEPLFEVETEKVTTEIPAPTSGVLKEIRVPNGATVPVGTVLAVIDTQTKAPAVPAAEKTTASPASAGPLRAPAMPAAVASGAAAEEELVPLSRLRRQTAEHMVRSLATSAHVLQAVEVDFARLEEARRAKGDAWRSREGFSLTYLPFVARAVCLAIAEFPWVNARFEGEALRVFRRVHLGIAVDLDFRGLIVPVVRDAQTKSVAELAREMYRLASAARSGDLKPDEASGGTYTLSNNGAFGTLFTAPIIHQPQVAILSTDAVQRRPAVVAGANGEAIAIRPIGILAHCFDHRAFDGAYSAAYLRRLKEILETRDWAAEVPPQ